MASSETIPGRSASCSQTSASGKRKFPARWSSWQWVRRMRSTRPIAARPRATRPGVVSSRTRPYGPSTSTQLASGYLPRLSAEQDASGTELDLFEVVAHPDHSDYSSSGRTDLFDPASIDLDRLRAHQHAPGALHADGRRAVGSVVERLLELRSDASQQLGIVALDEAGRLEADAAPQIPQHAVVGDVAAAAEVGVEERVVHGFARSGVDARRCLRDEMRRNAPRRRTLVARPRDEARLGLFRRRALPGLCVLAELGEITPALWAAGAATGRRATRSRRRRCLPSSLRSRTAATRHQGQRKSL